jgi:signal transduction histidine kinase
MKAPKIQTEIANEKRKINEYNRQIEFGKISRHIIHELMNHLNNLNLSIEHEMKTMNNNSIEEQLKMTILASNNLVTYINNAKKMMTAESIHATKDVPCNILEEINSVLSLLKPQLVKNNIDTEIECSKELTLPAHPTHIHQILFNLTNNAIQALNETDRNKKFIKIVCKELDKNTICLDVVDNGHGMSEEVQAKLFKKMFSTKADGTGLGLYTVANILDHELEGNIFCHSKQGVGTLFHVQIPIKGRFRILSKIFHTDL